MSQVLHAFLAVLMWLVSPLVLYGLRTVVVLHWPLSVIWDGAPITEVGDHEIYLCVTGFCGREFSCEGFFHVTPYLYLLTDYVPLITEPFAPVCCQICQPKAEILKYVLQLTAVEYSCWLSAVLFLTWGGAKLFPSGKVPPWSSQTCLVRVEIFVCLEFRKTTS